jgi:hypothetical protein
LITWAAVTRMTRHLSRNDPRTDNWTKKAPQGGIRCTIPEPAGQVGHSGRRGTVGGRPPAFDREECKARHAVECDSTG